MTNADDDALGYARPPRAHQFKKGRSGNPKGRPRKRKLERAYLTSQYGADIIEVMEEEVTVRTAKGPRREPAAKALLRALQAKAFQGHGPSARLALTLYHDAIAAHEDRLPNCFKLQILRSIQQRYGDNPPDEEADDLNHVRRWTREV